MNRYAALLSVFVLTILALPAHAVSNPDSTVNAINSALRSNSTVKSNSIGSGPGSGSAGGSGNTTICNASPENATVLLALLCGTGLVMGSRMRRVRMVRVRIS